MASGLPQNQARFTLGEVAQATGGALVASADASLVVTGVQTDSREALAGKLFVALGGERFDGHAFAKQAVANGAAAVVAERDVGDVGVPVVRVASTLGALGALAGAHRRRFATQVVGVAGSAGKTTTRSAVGALLELVAPGAVHQTRGNLNNAIGVPLVLLGLAARHRFAVVEIGTNVTGEVAMLTALAAPDAGVLTLVGVEHSEGLGDLDAIEREEGALFAGVRSGGTAIGNADDPRVARQLARFSSLRRVRYGFGAGADVRCVSRAAAGVGRQRVTLQGVKGELELELGLLGEAGAYAALAAVAVAEALGVELPDGERLSRALSAAGEPGRLEAHELADGTVVLDDAYNANPASAVASLRTAGEVAHDRNARLVLVFGEMRELGALSASEHARLGEAIATSGAAELIAVSGDARFYVDPAAKAGVTSVFTADAEAALAAARARVRPGDVVLVKASRGVRAERVVAGLLGRGPA
ncbi:MAG TPA: UDP-N-acetylmuramoyl-tripeptide--D-alanyl-D-alanine ligase [Polyangiaceae bacterium]|nr:UDP-N-acetylmuramoyl-tripeptide--D-alanyl-D-alanine ligase [Polyangiaceae bacterium]